MKKLFSLLLVVVMFASMALVSSAATATNYVTVEVVETVDGITCTYYITNPNNCAGFTASLVFPSTLSADKNTPYTLGDIFAPVVAKTSPGSKAGNVKYATAITDQADYVTATGTYEMISFDLTRTDDTAVYTSADFAYGTGLYVAKVAEGTTQLDNTKTADHFAAPVYVDNRAPIVVEPDYGYTLEGDTVTCYGKLTAEQIGLDYGVEFTAASTLEGARAQKYYGAKIGEIVNVDGTVTELVLNGWDGSFAIVLEGIHAGEKEFNFFVGEEYVEDTFTFVAE